MTKYLFVVTSHFCLKDKDIEAVDSSVVKYHLSCDGELDGALCALQEKPEREPRAPEEAGLVHNHPASSASLRPGHQTHLGADGSVREGPGQDRAVHRGQLQVIGVILCSPFQVTQRSALGVLVVAE